jgi:hypothetical protein
MVSITNGMSKLASVMASQAAVAATIQAQRHVVVRDGVTWGHSLITGLLRAAYEGAMASRNPGYVVEDNPYEPDSPEGNMWAWRFTREREKAEYEYEFAHGILY